MNKILLSLAQMSGNEQKYINEAFDTNWVVPLGPNVDAFEKDLEDFTGQGKKVVALCAGTAAIHLGLVQLGVEKDDEVICQSFTFSASANPIVYQGGKPVFVDSEPTTWNIDPELLEKAIKDRISKNGRKPKAIIPVHLYGMPARMNEIMEIAQRYEIPVLEDAAEAMGSTYHGQKCGTFGKYGVFSFNGNKMITTSGGGALICPDDESKQRVKFFATQAREHFPYYQHEHIGYNYRLSNICAGIGRGQMTVVNDHVTRRRQIHNLYKELLADIDGVTLKNAPDATFDSNYWLSCILIDPNKYGHTNDELRLYLDKVGIESRLLWKPMHLQPIFKDAPAYTNGVSEQMFSQGLCLPSGSSLSDNDILNVVNTIKAFRSV